MKEYGTSDPIKLKYGNTNTYLVGALLIDTDLPGTLPALWWELKRQGISPDRIRYAFVAHFHPDHMGLVGELQQNGVTLILSGHQLASVHASDALFAREKRSPFVAVDERKAIVISADESRSFLRGIGIAGEIVRTKSHSPDGAAVILDDGNAFVGDIEPREYLDGYGDNPALREDWETILSHGVKTVHYGHANDQRLP